MPEITKAKPAIKRPVREDRVAEVAGERRRRKEFGLRSRLNFSVPDEYRDDPNYVYRWAADRPGRVTQLHGEDYDFVESKEIAEDARQTGAGTRIERHAGTDKEGKPLRQYLMRKKREFYQHDKAAEQADLSKRMAAIKRGKTAGQDGQPIHDDGAYVPQGGIVIQENYQP